MAEEPQEKQKKWRGWAWKALVAVLVPFVALIAKDVYDYVKASLDPAKGKPPSAIQHIEANPPQASKPIVAEALMERARSLAQPDAAGTGRPFVRDVLSKSPLPLIIAARNGQISLVRILLERGANVNLRDQETEVTPLIVAAQNGHLQVVDLLLEKGAEVNARDKNGKTALREALRNRHEDVVKALRAKGAQ
jgi:hypothetical protein